MHVTVRYLMKLDVEYGAPSFGHLQPIPDAYVFSPFETDSLLTCYGHFSMQAEISYLPRTRPLPRTIEPFPLLPTREDWPYTREVIGGWSLTPFGGRGRFDGRIVEVEGIVSSLISHFLKCSLFSKPQLIISWASQLHRHLARRHRFLIR